VFVNLCENKYDVSSILAAIKVLKWTISRDGSFFVCILFLILPGQAPIVCKKIRTKLYVSYIGWDMNEFFGSYWKSCRIKLDACGPLKRVTGRLFRITKVHSRKQKVSNKIAQQRDIQKC
jgi:hypothetical protein